MESRPIDEQTAERMQSYVEEVVALVNAHIRQRPDPHLLETAWRIGFATLLAEIVRGSKMLPEEMETYLAEVETQLRFSTTELIRRGDASGWRLP